MSDGDISSAQSEASAQEVMSVETDEEMETSNVVVAQVLDVEEEDMSSADLETSSPNRREHTADVDDASMENGATDDTASLTKASTNASHGKGKVQSDAAHQDSDDDEVTAVVVVEGDPDNDIEEIAQAEIVEVAGDDEAAAVEGDAKPKKKVKKGKKTSKKKAAKRRRAHQANSSGLPPERLDAAADARDSLIETIQRLPVEIDTHTVRSFGRLHVQESLDNPFCTASALFPVGFSSDRYEFSPVHGRVLKLRCTILDASNADDKKEPEPVFRVMWGQAVDDDVDEMDYPFDPFSVSAPITGGENVDAIALPPADQAAAPAAPPPEVGMRVKVRFEADEWYSGTIVHVNEESDSKKKRKNVEICIQYDDGSSEDAQYPDPDIHLAFPGEEDGNSILDSTERQGKSVTSVYGATPLEAWGKALVKLGLIDEIVREAAMKSLVTSREKGRAEALDKMNAQKVQRQQTRSKQQNKQRAESQAEENSNEVSSPKSQVTDTVASPIPSESADVPNTNTAEAMANEGDEPSEEQEKEATTEHEEELLAKVEKNGEELGLLMDESRQALIALTNARIKKLGPFLVNPFSDAANAQTQQASWLGTVIRKEKAKMGSTGNKKKIVTRTDLLERNDTFFNGEIEHLLEGLPGSEFCTAYVFQEFRSGGAATLSQAWIHEAEIRRQKEKEKRAKLAKEAQLKASQQKEKELKKRKRDEDRDARKRQKLEEEEQKKKARVEDRLSRLSLQVDERLFKEACIQREKVVVIINKVMGKEFLRRRKAAEFVAGNAVLNVEDSKEVFNESKKTQTVPTELPQLSRTYDEGVLRVWDFIESFGSAFLDLGFLRSLPSLDALQTAVDSVRKSDKISDGQLARLSKSEATDALTDVATALCKPLAASLTKLLFASLIALNPGLQKDYGASFFAEMNATSDNVNTSLSSLLPVNEMTWREIARLAFLSDALAELGQSRQEVAHLLRGYRSGGHPNSKEAKRLRWTEDFPFALLRQNINERRLEGESQHADVVRRGSWKSKTRVFVPCTPSASPADWTFYLHNVKSLPAAEISAIKWNINKAMEHLRSAKAPDDMKESMIGELKKSLVLMDKVKKSDDADSEPASLRNGRQLAMQVLDRVTAQTLNSSSQSRVAAEKVQMTDLQDEPADQSGHLFMKNGPYRCRVGLLQSLCLTDQQYKTYVHKKEDYMADALRLKEDMEMREKKAAGEIDDDDDEEDDDDENSLDDEEKGRQSQEETNAKGRESTDQSQEQTSAKAKVTIGQSQEETSAKGQESMDATDDDGTDNKKAVKDSSTFEQSAGMEPPSTARVASVVENGTTNETAESETSTRKIGKPTEWDEFCEDLPDAPDLIRRCLAVLRTLCQAVSSAQFIYPVDPQTNPGYYETILKPMCLREVGRILQSSGKDLENARDNEAVETVVLEFGRNVRLIRQNCLCYSNVGALILTAAEDMIRIFERLFFEWVLAPDHLLSPLERLDDERCVEYHPSDEDSLVLLCDGCEGKYNMSRLEPPLLEVPKDDWYCPRCLSGRSFQDVDPRIGRRVKRAKSQLGASNGHVTTSEGVIQSSQFCFEATKGSSASLMYVVQFDDGIKETWPLHDVDSSLAEAGNPVSPVRCLEAVAESPGYRSGTDLGYYANLVPVPLNASVSESAAQATISSSVFRDTIACTGSLLLTNPDEMKSFDWLRLLILLVMKCSSSEMMLALASKMESRAADEMASQLSSSVRFIDTLPPIQNMFNDAESVGSAASRDLSEDRLVDSVGESTIENVKSGLDDMAVVEADAVEVLAADDDDAMDISQSAEVLPVVSSAELVNEDEKVKLAQSLPEADDKRKARSAALAERDSRQKSREDSIAAYCIKNQLRAAVSSFEEDAVSQVVDSIILRKKPGLDFPSTRCRGMVCFFCGLSETALGTPLVRVPDSSEWREYMPHASGLRTFNLVANTENLLQKQTTAGDESEVEKVQSISSPITLREGSKPKLVSVTVRVGGELVSVKEEPSHFDHIVDGGMLEFLPRNEDGFQHELQFRSDAKLLFISGSLSAHECCAITAHDARKELSVQRYREKRSMLAERDCGMTCGRTLALGSDDLGRTFWKFHSDPSSLFVCIDDDVEANGNINRRWLRFSKPEDIASVILCLARHDISTELRRTFPEAAEMARSGKWSELLQKRFWSQTKETPAATNQKSVEANHKEKEDSDSDDEEEPYEVGEEVLVESKSGKQLWDAVVVAVSKCDGQDKVAGYRVHYREWSTRFDEWVKPLRVVEPNENNRQVQEELMEDLLSSKNEVPLSLEKMKARRFLNKGDRSRGSAKLPDFLTLSMECSGASFNEYSLSILKAALLLVEASIPLGALDISETGQWSADRAIEWRYFVRIARGPSSLMRCVILLEEAIHPDWVEEKIGHLLTCMPLRLTAFNEASTSSLALRVFLLDQGISYGKIQKKKK